MKFEIAKTYWISLGAARVKGTVTKRTKCTVTFELLSEKANCYMYGTFSTEADWKPITLRASRKFNGCTMYGDEDVEVLRGSIKRQKWTSSYEVFACDIA